MKSIFFLLTLLAVFSAPVSGFTSETIWFEAEDARRLGMSDSPGLRECFLTPLENGDYRLVVVTAQNGSRVESYYIISSSTARLWLGEKKEAPVIEKRRQYRRSDREADIFRADTEERGLYKAPRAQERNDNIYQPPLPVSTGAGFTGRDWAGFLIWNSVGTGLSFMAMSAAYFSTGSGTFGMTALVGTGVLSLATSIAYFNSHDWTESQFNVTLVSSAAGGLGLWLLSGNYMYSYGWTYALLGGVIGAAAGITIACFMPDQVQLDRQARISVNPAALAAGLSEKPGDAVGNAPAAISFSYSF